MSGTYRQFKTDGALERDGVALDYDGFSITVARAGGSNRRYSAAMAQRTKAIRSALRTGHVDEATNQRILREVMADTVVLGWAGVTGRDGEPLPFSRENVVRLFTDLPDLMADVFQQASELANFLEAQAAEDAGK